MSEVMSGILIIVLALMFCVGLCVYGLSDPREVRNRIERERNQLLRELLEEMRKK